MVDRHRLDARQRGLGRRLGCTDHSPKPGAARAFGDGQRSGHRSDSPIERELTYRRVLDQPLGRKLPGRGENRERDRQVEAGSLLAQRGRSEIDGDPAIEWPLERRRDDAAPDPVFGLLACPVDQPDDGEPGNARLHVRLHLDLSRLESDESVGDRPCEHPDDGRREGVTRG